MFSAIGRMLGIVDVKEGPRVITITGLPGNTFGKDITKTWSTSKLANYMFNQITTSKLTFNKFFAIDVLYVLDELRRSPRAYGVNRRALKKTIDELNEQTWLRSIHEPQNNILDFSGLKEFNKTPLEHQMTFLERYNEYVPKYNLKGYLLAAKPGAGKTIAGLMLGKCLKADVVVVISPANAVKRVWEASIRTEMKKEYIPWIASEGKPLERGREYYIFHYEAMDKLADLLPMISGKKVLVLVDESHNFNDIKSARTQHLVNFCQRSRCENVVWASGTPVKALGYEMIPFLRTVDPFFDNDSEERFRKIYGKSVSKAVEILRNRIGMLSFKVEKQEFTASKPIETTVKVQVADAKRFTLDTIRKDMSDYIQERLKYYQANEKTYRSYYNAGLEFYAKTLTSPADKQELAQYRRYVAMIVKGYDPVMMKNEAMFCNRFELGKVLPKLPQPLRNQFKSARSVIKYVSLKIQGEALGRVLGGRRAECNVALITRAGLLGIIDSAEKKTVIFTSFVDVAEQTVKYLQSQGYKPAIVYADTNKNLNAIITQFFNDDDCNPLVATFQSLSSAVPLTAANNVVLMNQPYREWEREQAISRADRIGQDTQVYVHNILLDTGGEANISTRAADIVQWSREMVAAIMGTKPMTEGEAVISVEEFVESYEGKEQPIIHLPVIDRPKSTGW